MRRLLLLPLLLLSGALVGPFSPLAARLAAQSQGGPALAVTLTSGAGSAIPISVHRGYPAFAATDLVPLGWTLSAPPGSGALTARHRTGLTLHFNAGSPFFNWDGTLLQLVHPPYWFGEGFYLPLQLVADLLPGLLPRAYRFDADRFALEVEGAVVLEERALPPSRGVGAEPPRVAEPAARPPRLVVIDPGHGGGDPGAIGPGGTQEKDVALALALALARELSGDPEIEVRLTRDGDREVPLWSRGEWATEWKGDRPGVFISIHANALPDRRTVRGFETYFLSEARDEHERRVAALENAPLASAGATGDANAADPLLGAILRDLRTFDHQHWSADLAEEVQRELGRIHPGPDRGVKQGPFAVITNSMMPSVLVEVGFITNPEEERLLTRSEFHQDSAEALARAIRGFFDRYPPGR